jgi:hypothetical protein
MALAVALAVGVALLVDGGEGSGGCGCGVGSKGGREGGGQGGCQGGGRGVLIFDLLLISLHFSQTIILTINVRLLRTSMLSLLRCNYRHNSTPIAS